MNKYIYIISVLIIFTILSIISSVADKKKIDYVANEYKKVQASNTELVKENKKLKQYNLHLIEENISLGKQLEGK